MIQHPFERKFSEEEVAKLNTEQESTVEDTNEEADDQITTEAFVEYLDTRLFPTQLRLSWHPQSRQGRLHLPSGNN